MSLTSLVAYGSRDVYITGNPQVTFFRVTYRRHTNFAMECMEMDLGHSTCRNIFDLNVQKRHEVYVECGHCADWELGTLLPRYSPWSPLPTFTLRCGRKNLTLFVHFMSEIARLRRQICYTRNDLTEVFPHELMLLLWPYVEHAVKKFAPRPRYLNKEVIENRLRILAQRARFNVKDSYFTNALWMFNVSTT